MEVTKSTGRRLDEVFEITTVIVMRDVKMSEA